MQANTTMLAQFRLALQAEDGNRLAQLLNLSGGHTKALARALEKGHTKKAEDDARKLLGSPWDDVVVQHLRVLLNKQRRNYAAAFEEQHTLVHKYVNRSFLRIFNNLSRWSLPVLYVINWDLRSLGIEADAESASRGQPGKCLEVAARAINKSFSTCITDRASISASRKWGTYYVGNLLFKTYFKLKQQNLCKNVLRAIRASTDLPELSQFPKSHQVTFHYYQGLLYFLEAQYKQADEHFTSAFRKCPKQFYKNKEYALDIVVDVSFTKRKLPSSSLLDEYPSLKALYWPFIDAIKTGNIKSFDKALSDKEKRLIIQGTYFNVELAREIAKRVLFKKVWLIHNKQSRIHVGQFQAALRFVGMDVEMAEVEWYLATAIAKGYIRGYLSHDKLTAVLSVQNPFPRLD
ncbi:10150_t:CDS:10 [Paraglomus occultum]|uniref:10150_t:CDS:1 n=1 Tax=Paraglomus occultum TaxID=144539 RepID=A0A9N9FGM9_9GLOM|nr:10150_t:CDS:10 [Paraglomus occultum]